MIVVQATGDSNFALFASPPNARVPFTAVPGSYYGRFIGPVVDVPPIDPIVGIKEFIVNPKYPPIVKAARKGF